MKNKEERKKKRKNIKKMSNLHTILTHNMFKSVYINTYRYLCTNKCE